MKADVDLAYGQRCTRCRQLLEEGQILEPDHLDGGGPTDYLGWAHASCNHAAGAARGNRLRAAAYRALRTGVAPRVAAAANGARYIKTHAVAYDGHVCVTEGCHEPQADREHRNRRCACGRHSQAW